MANNDGWFRRALNRVRHAPPDAGATPGQSPARARVVSAPRDGQTGHTGVAVVDAAEGNGRQRGGELAPASPPPGPPPPPSGPSWVAEITSKILQSETMQRLQAVARSQVAEAVSGAAWALSNLPEGQRQVMAADMARDFGHIQTICDAVARLSPKASREEIAKALDDLGYVAERLIAYYTKYIGLLGASVPRLSISAMSTEERGALRGMAQEVGNEAVAKQAAQRARKTNEALQEVLALLTGRSAKDKEQDKDKSQAPKKAIGADEMTYALGKLAALAESMNQALRTIYGQLKSQPRTMPQKAAARVKGVMPWKNKKQPRK